MVAVPIKAAAALLLGARGAAINLADAPRPSAVPMANVAANVATPMPLAAEEMSLAAPAAAAMPDHLAATAGAARFPTGVPAKAALPPALGGIPSMQEHRRMEALDAAKEAAPNLKSTRPRAIRVPDHTASPMREQEKAIRSLSTNLERYHSATKTVASLVAARDVKSNASAQAAEFVDAARSELRDCKEKRLEAVKQEMSTNTASSAKDTRTTLKSTMVAVASAEKRYLDAQSVKRKADTAVEQADARLQIALKKQAYFRNKVKDAGHEVGIAAKAVTKLQDHHAREAEKTDAVAATLEQKRVEIEAAIVEATKSGSKA